MKVQNFKELVDRAYTEIKGSLTSRNPYLFKEDYADGPNYSEICYWCGFPDYGTPDSIYEKAINVAVLILGYEFGTQKDINKFLKNKYLF